MIESTVSPAGDAGPSGTPGRERKPVTDRRLRVLCCVVGGTGLGLVIWGSFLPWVVSGSVRRSSYAIVGVVDRLGVAGDGVLALLVTGWPLLGVLAMSPVIAGCLRWWRTAGILSVLAALPAAGVSIAILVVAVGKVGLTVRLDPIGPAVMTAGALLLLAGGVCLAFGIGSPHRPNRYSTKRG
ncbi:hypothetical protein ACVBEQ_14935 [Nakamurella sp. GG22]